MYLIISKYNEVKNDDEFLKFISKNQRDWYKKKSVSLKDLSQKNIIDKSDKNIDISKYQSYLNALASILGNKLRFTTNVI